MSESCVLCFARELENETWFSAWEPFPVGIGHRKLMPKRHDADFFNLTDQEKVDFWDLLQKNKDYLNNSLGSHKPDGYNIGINYGEAAGQTIGHLHVHLIPRYKGDVENPRGGVRNIKPSLVSW
ncbi:MAG: HIT family protein [Parcubacteria group bacterium]|nr:HIT family protein [Parcubacteria group bacterium]